MNFNSSVKKTCTLVYSEGKGTGVSEAIGNWGFSNEVASPGHELSRMKCLLNKMESLRDPRCVPVPKRKECVFRGSTAGMKPRKMPKYYPLVLYGSINERIPCANMRLINKDNVIPMLNRSYCLQGTDKWYKVGPSCCPPPSCPVACYPHAPHCCPHGHS